jgi:hypothetical protein
MVNMPPTLYVQGWKDCKTVLIGQLEFMAKAEDPTSDGYYVRQEIYDKIICRLSKAIPSLTFSG